MPFSSAIGSTEGWYQIEVIVFANNATTDTDEVWPLTEKHYPERMVSIGPESTDDIRPETMGQLRDIQGYLDLWDETQSIDKPQESSDFLFESRNSPTLSAPQATTQATTEESETGEIQEPAIDYAALFEREEAIAFQDLPQRERILSSVARSLNRSSMYRVLLHHSWLQPVLSDDKATPILIQSGKRYDDVYELDGTLTISRSRFLHIETDLWLTQFSPLVPDMGEQLNTSRLASPLDGRLAISRELRTQYPEVADWMSNRGQHIPVHAHHLSQSRRMRSATLHFIDHPRFGLLIRIERFEPPIAAR